MARIDIVERPIGDVILLTLAGRLVLEEGTDPLRERIDSLIQRGRLDLILDLHGVTYIDSCGVGTVVAKYLSLRRRGGDLKLLNLSERCRHVFTITGLLPVLEPFESEEAAVRSFTTADRASV